jgi:hypothetical protein
VQFSLPNDETFEIPDAWWDESGMSEFVRSSRAYAAKSDPDHLAVPWRPVPLGQIERPRRDVGCEFDFGGFKKHKLVCFLRGIAEHAVLPAVPIKPAKGELPYQVYNGFHRYYASAAAGFDLLPAVILPDFAW